MPALILPPSLLDTFTAHRKAYDESYTISKWIRNVTGVENRAITALINQAINALDEFEEQGVKFHYDPNDRLTYFRDIYAVRIASAELLSNWVKEHRFTKFDRDLLELDRKILAAQYRMKDHFTKNKKEVKLNTNLKNHSEEEIIAQNRTALMNLAKEWQNQDPTNKLMPARMKLLLKVAEYTSWNSRFFNNNDYKNKVLQWVLKEGKSIEHFLLIEMATESKKKDKFWKNKELDSLQLKQLELAAAYTEWFPFVISDAAYRSKFFKWALQDLNSVEVFITCPLTTKRIRDAITHPIFGKILKDAKGESFLCFGRQSFIELKKHIDGLDSSDKIQIGEKRVLSIPVYIGTPDDLKADHRMRRCNILNPENIMEFCGGVAKKVKEFFLDRSKVNDRVPDIAMTPYGALNFNSAKAGYWDARLKDHIRTINIESKADGTPQDPLWYLKLVPTMIVKRSFLTEWHGPEKIDGKTPFVEIGASREQNSNSSLGAHGFLRFYFPVGQINQDGEEYYHVVDIGKFGVEYANSPWKQFVLFCGSILAVLMCMDPNGFYSHRQFALLPVFPTQAEVEKLLESLRQHMLKELYFQFVAENCASFVEEWIHEVFKELPPLFSVNLFSGRGGIPLLDGYLSKFKACHWIIQFLAVLPILILTFAWRWVTIKIVDKDGKVTWERKSVLQRIYNTVKNKKDLCNPTMLFEKCDIHKNKREYKVEVGQLNICYGNSEYHLSREEKNRLDANAAV